MEVNQMEVKTLKEIAVADAINMPYLMIDMATPVKGYEKYDFHRGMRCKIDGFPFELMSENEELSLEAEAISITKWRQKESNTLKLIPEFKGGETIAIIKIFDGYAKAFTYTLPDKVRQQSFIIK